MINSVRLRARQGLKRPVTVWIHVISPSRMNLDSCARHILISGSAMILVGLLVGTGVSTFPFPRLALGTSNLAYGMTLHKSNLTRPFMQVPIFNSSPMECFLLYKHSSFKSSDLFVLDK
jgi:hypothetical protein